MLAPRRHLPCALVVALMLCGCGGGSHHSARATARPPLISIFESGPQLRSDPARTLNILHALGVDVVKVFVPWTELAPNATSSTPPPSSFDASDPASYPAAAWAPFDAIVRDAAARGLGVDVTVNSPPLWAAGPGAPPGAHPQWRPKARAYGRFLQAVATRYSGHYTPAGSSGPLPRVSYWSIWNEPNYGPDLAPQAIDNSSLEVSPVLYRRLLDAGWEALKASGHGHDTILIGELAPRGQTGGSHPGNFDGMVPLRFLRALYCVDSSLRPLGGAAAVARHCPTGANAQQRFRARHPALFEAGGFAVHPYGQGSIPPNQITPGEPDYADFAAIPKLERMLDQLQRIYGSSHRFPIYSTEFGYQTNPPEKIAGAAAPPTAAAYLNWAEYLSWRDPRIVSYDQYQLIDPPRANAIGGFATGLLFADGRPKATFNAYRLPLYLPVTTAKRGAALEVWGAVRPARFIAGAQPVRVQFRPAGGGGFSTLRTVRLDARQVYFDLSQRFPASGIVRLSWSYPNGRKIHSRKVSVELR